MTEAIQQSVDIQVPPQRPRELAMSAAWNGALQREVTLTTGERSTVVYHGTWSNG